MRAQASWEVRGCGDSLPEQGQGRSVPGESRRLLLLALKCSVCETVMRIFFAESSSDCSPPQPPSSSSPPPGPTALREGPRGGPGAEELSLLIQSWPLPRAAPRAAALWTHRVSPAVCCTPCGLHVGRSLHKQTIFEPLLWGENFCAPRKCHTAVGLRVPVTPSLSSGGSGCRVLWPTRRAASGRVGDT